MNEYSNVYIGHIHDTGVRIMFRTQVYLTEEERCGLAQMVEFTGRKQSQLIREAVDQFLYQARELRAEHTLNKASGLWCNRDDLPDFDEIRRSWDRGMVG
ncbi:ribbon-helix-helix domain-containing protein [Kiritimatiella glycovorans]|uniref:Ribbon-helix-helix protein CopG domain-containing protein n=1 Tax=Kiritimatiella glycovorans TaxID=1307763 RepID=A0A0G3EKI1_9BACT|nr:ribbon-helix-helix domain-containing protein [Kiritimatiella glycovorans]AKJ64684.1 hypothetical protein L21SP4_01438 [Kiritimatiella glycovorans]